ncbi:ribosomal L7Ae/L30e/S12e/Gadd45 family protein [Candidatus Woesearchaeota archaeon]|nr:ribosomal L7Ae/L30e/S12e/Gadd45 family protein [Candidatus Woesearchaeota archaeon]
MAEEPAEKHASEIRKLLKEGQLIIGTDRTLKGIKQGKVVRVFLASNTAKETRESIEHYASLAGFEVSILPVLNDELGVVCKKPFSISVLSVKK